VTTYAPGTTATLTVQWVEYDGGPPVDVTAQTITITRLVDGYRLFDAVSAGIVHVATGLYTYAWSIAVDAAEGGYAVLWNATDTALDAVQASEIATVATPAAQTPVDSYATLQEYCDRIGVTSLPAAKAVQAAAYLGDASALMRSKLPAGFTPDPEIARTLCVEIVQRKIANPGGYDARTFGAYSETLDKTKGLYITEDEISRLLGEGPPGQPDEQAYTLMVADHGLRDVYNPRLTRDPWFERF